MYEDDIHFILSEVLRISKIPVKERLQLPFPENLAMIPHPSGRGHMMCGLAADRRFRQLAETAVARSKEAGRVDAAVVYEKLKFIVVDRFLRELRELNTSQADRAVQAAVRVAAKAKKDLTHFLPCHLGHARTPDKFTIGPVIFEQQSEVFERLAPALKEFAEKDRVPESTSDEEQRRSRADISKQLVKNAEEYYGSFGWVAQVTISDCDPKTSQRRAMRIVQSALDCLHLLIGTAYSNHMRVGGPRFSTDRRGRIEMDADGRIDISTSVDWQAHNLGESWWDHVNQAGGSELIELMGAAIHAGHAIPNPAPLARRFLDAVAWYGEAARDDFSASRVIKYVTAMERILTTNDETKIVEAISTRGASLTFQPETDGLGQRRSLFSRVYNLRSELVHGSRSPVSAEFGQQLRDAEELARTVLFRALRFFRREGITRQDVSISDLDAAYDRVLKWANAVSSRAESPTTASSP